MEFEIEVFESTPALPFPVSLHSGCFTLWDSELNMREQ